MHESSHNLSLSTLGPQTLCELWIYLWPRTHQIFFAVEEILITMSEKYDDYDDIYEVVHK